MKLHHHLATGLLAATPASIPGSASSSGSCCPGPSTLRTAALARVDDNAVREAMLGAKSGVTQAQLGADIAKQRSEAMRIARAALAEVRDYSELTRTASTPATAQVFVQDHGEKLHRRSMYTYWKRTAPPANMVAVVPRER